MGRVKVYRQNINAQVRFANSKSIHQWLVNHCACFPVAMKLVKCIWSMLFSFLHLLGENLIFIRTLLTFFQHHPSAILNVNSIILRYMTIIV
jgi:hypothetical protein